MGYKQDNTQYFTDITEFFSIGKWSGVAPKLRPEDVYYILVLMQIKREISLVAKKYGHSCYLSSAYRCEEHNKKAGGKANSQHKFMEAIDLSISNVDDFIKKARKEIEEIIKRYFVLQCIKYSWGIHFSIETARSTQAGLTRFISID